MRRRKPFIPRPLRPEERAPLAVLAAELRRLRGAAPRSRVAWAAGLSCSHYAALEAGQRRTRASTLGRLAGALAAFDCSLGPPAELAERLCDLAGKGLAPERMR